jgi:hypothetical protein
VFGRVKTCYPSDGVLDNIEELELYFPQKDRAPDVLHLHKDEIRRSSQKHAQSYFVRVRVFASEREATELSEAASLLGMNGFYPEFDTGYLDLLDMTSQNQTSYPWLYVIGSRWFDSVPDSLQTEMAGKLKEMIGWDRRIFNYHPGWLSNEINTLNRTLGFKYGFTDTVLTEPGDAKQVGFIVAKLFEQSILHL